MRTGIFGGALLCLIAAGAAAADLPAVAPPPSPQPHPFLTWNGLYAGVNVGYGGDTFAYPYQIAGAGTSLTTPNFSLTSGGILGGGQIGYNLALFENKLPYEGGLVIGAEGDYDAASISGNNSQLAAVSPVAGNAGGGLIGTKITSIGTGRGRLGLSFGRLMVYGTGGIAFATVRSNSLVTLGRAAAASSASEAHTGAVFGGGVEFLVTQNVTFKLEYLRTNLDEKAVNTGTVGARIYALGEQPRANVVRGGLNYKIDLFSAPIPVVARY